MSPGAYSRSDKQETQYLRDLIRDFGADGCPSAEIALDLIFKRYTILQSNFVDIAEWIVTQADYKGDLRDIFKATIICGVHELLFEGVLSNAGQYRKSDEPKGGRVFFGGQRGDRRQSRFEGSLPHRIETDLDVAFGYLSPNLGSDEDPVRSAILFYADFVYIHPFYDGNGRIARLLVSLYLYLHAYYVDWQELDKKQNKFLKKLNACHDRRESVNVKKYRSYQNLLVRFFKKYVVPHEEFYRREVS